MTGAPAFPPTRGVVLPYWLDRPAREALAIADAAEGAGYPRLWVGEMATFDAFALASAIAVRTRGLRLTVGPLAAGVRSPVAIALGIASVAIVGERPADCALGASSPDIVCGWHERPWAPLPALAATAAALRTLLAGERSQGFRLRAPQHATRLAVAAFQPQMTRLAARVADEVLLNLVPVAHVAGVRARVDAAAAVAGRPRPRLAVWLPVALEPGAAARSQLAAQLAVYLRPPGYGEMFARLGFAGHVERARAGESRRTLAADLPDALLHAVGALGSAADLHARVEAYHRAGADHVGLVPSTAEDPAGRAVLAALAPD